MILTKTLNKFVHNNYIITSTNLEYLNNTFLPFPIAPTYGIVTDGGHIGVFGHKSDFEWLCEHNR